MNGISTNKRCSSSAECLAESNIDFVIRYYSETTQQAEKHLLPGEAQALDEAGLRLAAVYQDRQTQVADFSRASGHRDGRFAFQYAREIGQPLGTAIFFAVDYDAAPGHINQIKAYFRGVADGLAEASGENDSYQIGVYGSGYTCRRLDEADLVSHKWLSESTGHRESADYEDWNVKQYVTNQSLCNLPSRSWQRCESQGNDNSWSFRLNEQPSPPPVPSPGETNWPLLRWGASGSSVETLQRFLNIWISQEGGQHLLEDGDFGPKTNNAVRAFQASNVDSFGRPLAVDGIVGGLTWGALERIASGGVDPAPNPIVLPGVSGEWWKEMPASSFGGSARGRSALEKAVGEAADGSREQGGNNMGPDVRKYLNGIVDTPANWCAGFVSWCLRESGPMPIDYTVGARDILNQARNAGLETFDSPVTTPPQPGDIIVWWRVARESWEGHTGFIHHAEGGRIYTIEGNKTSRVEGFDYSIVAMEQLLGFVRL